MNTLPVDAEIFSTEWLEADALGGFASGTVGGVCTRRYHALLLAPLRPPGDRVVLVNTFEAWITSPAGDFALCTHEYAPDVFHPRGRDCLVAFRSKPWPTWTYRGPGDIEVVHECMVEHATGRVLLSWRLAGGAGETTLHVRPLLSGRDMHGLMRENPAFDFASRAVRGNVTWRPYPQLPAITARSNGAYEQDPCWYRNFHYRDEAARGLDHVEDLGSPGNFRFALGDGAAVLLLESGDADADADAGADAGADADRAAQHLRAIETARREPRTPLDRAADTYFVGRGKGHTLIAGYPWFGDWGRDTFIAMRGLCIERGQFDMAASILLEWAGLVSEGMLPNRFPDHGEPPEYNSVDAALWYVIALQEYLAAARPRPAMRKALLVAAHAILDGYQAGTRFGIGMDHDGLIACGVPGLQLTWMDARCEGRVITPRIGKPVEIQALWINALQLTGGRYGSMAKRASESFHERFWNPAADCLHDVVDADHVPGRLDPSIRPNQVLAVGGLPHGIVTGARARSIVSTVERELLTPMGLRTLSPSDPAYEGHYQGGVAQRDAAYHQGTVWPWLIGPFVESWLRVHGSDAAHRAQARLRFLGPLTAHLGVAGLGHVSEIADGDAPHTPRGCPFQAWSLGELLRALSRTAPQGLDHPVPPARAANFPAQP